MAHIEFSLTALGAPAAIPDLDGQGFGALAVAGSLTRWAVVVSGAAEPCVLLDAAGAVVAASPGCAALFSINAAEVVGRPLVPGVLRLRDFNSVAGELPEWEIDKIPPLLAIRSGVLARGLLRVSSGDVAATVDAISTPLRDGSALVGSLTFFAPIGR